eukprot:tig00020516_g9955.t1
MARQPKTTAPAAQAPPAKAKGSGNPAKGLQPEAEAEETAIDVTEKPEASGNPVPAASGHAADGADKVLDDRRDADGREQVPSAIAGQPPVASGNHLLVSPTSKTSTALAPISPAAVGPPVGHTLTMISPLKRITVARTFADLKDGRDFEGIVRIGNMHSINGQNGTDSNSIRGTLEDEVGDKIAIRIFTGAIVKNAEKMAAKGDIVQQVNAITDQLSTSCSIDGMYLIMRASKARYLVKGTANEKLAWPISRDRTMLKEIQINSGNVGNIAFEAVHEQDPRLSSLPHKLASMEHAVFTIMRYEIVSDFKAATVDYMSVNRQCESNRFSEYNVHCVIKEDEDGYVCMDKHGCKVSARFGKDAKFDTLGVLYDNYSVNNVADIVVSFVEFKFERPAGKPVEMWFGYFSEVMGLAEYEQRKTSLPDGFVTKSLKTPDVQARMHASVPLGNATNRLGLFPIGPAANSGSGLALNGTGGPVTGGFNGIGGAGSIGHSSSSMAMAAIGSGMQPQLLTFKANPFAVSRGGSEASFHMGQTEREPTGTKRKSGGNAQVTPKKTRKTKDADVTSDVEGQEDAGEEDEEY